MWKILCGNCLPGNIYREGDRVMIMSNLGSMVFFTKSRQEGFDLLNEALRLSKTIKDGGYTAYTYGVLAGRYQIDNNLKAAWQSIDSAVYYSKRTERKKFKGFVAYMQGWMHTRTGDRQKAVAYYQSALKILEGQQAYTYESAIYEELALAFSEWDERVTREKYIRLCYTASLNTGLPDYIVAGTYNLALMFESHTKQTPPAPACSILPCIILKKRWPSLTRTRKGSFISPISLLLQYVSAIFMKAIPLSEMKTALPYTSISD